VCNGQAQALGIKTTQMEHLKDIAVMVGALVAIATFVKAIAEFTRQGAQKRAELFKELRHYFRDNEQFLIIMEMLASNNSQLANLPYKDKADFIGFYEEIAILMNSRLIEKHIAHYMFSYYAIRCWENEYFWAGLNRNAAYWELFKHFVKDMKNLENSFSFNIKNYRL
jgi:hypothetical protein